ncbi:MAG: HAD family hydrolase [Chloroflexi bacterium]|nr:HAD family hydrolase [Chloroflexota bacterium]
MFSKQITTIVFDLDDTLRYSDPHAHNFFCDFAETLGGPFNREQRRAAQRWEHRYWANSDDLLADIEIFTQGSEAFWLNYSQRHLQALGFQPTEAGRLAPVAHTHMRDNYKPVSRVHAETIGALKEFRNYGYLLGVITNRSKPIYSEMYTIGLDLHFDFYLTGSQLGAYKPRKEIFENLVAFTGHSKDELLYIGDNYYADVVGARSAGIEAALLNWNDLYADVDCPSIRSIPELLPLLQPQFVS